jgi:LuxR family maltose regulon positive regulatory protein
MHRRASRWYEAQRLIEVALHHALAARDFEQAAHLVERNALRKIQRGELASLCEWFRALPEAIIQTRPWLCVFQAFEKYWAGPREETVKHLDMAEKALQSASHLSATERDHIEGYIAAVRAFYASQEENLPVILTMARKAMTLVPESDYVSALCALALIAVYWGYGDVVLAQETCHRSKIIAMKIDHPMHVTSSAYYESLQQIKRGQLNEAYHTLQDALQWLAAREKQDDLAAGSVLIRIGDILREWNHLDEAWDRLQRALKLSQQAGFCDYLVDAYLIQARLCLAERKWPGAREAIDRALRLAGEVQFDAYVYTWLDDIRLRLWIHEGDIRSVRKWMESSGLQYEGALDYLHDLDHVNLARAMLGLKGEDPSGLVLHQARQLLDRLSEAVERAGWIHERIMILLLRALVHKSLGQTDEAVVHLASALAIAEPEGWVRSFIDEGEPMPSLLKQAAARGVTPGYSAKLLAAMELERKG